MREGTNEVAAFSLEALSTLGPKEGDPKRAAAVSPRRERDGFGNTESATGKGPVLERRESCRGKALQKSP